MKMGRVFVLALSASFSMTVAACSKHDGLSPVPAGGTVTLKGEPLASGNIQFYPTSGARPAGGGIKDGKFTLTTYEGNDGAIPGKHNVSVTAYKDVKVAGQSELQQVLIIPENYANPGTSGISVEIPPAGNTDLKIELK